MVGHCAGNTLADLDAFEVSHLYVAGGAQGRLWSDGKRGTFCIQNTVLTLNDAAPTQLAIMTRCRAHAQTISCLFNDGLRPPAPQGLSVRTFEFSGSNQRHLATIRVKLRSVTSRAFRTSQYRNGACKKRFQRRWPAVSFSRITVIWLHGR